MAIRVDGSAEPTATSLDADGATERVELRGRPGERVFTYLHLPASTPRGAFLICSPLHGEFARNYRREVLLARALAQQGFAVERFHYRHSGNSDGDDTDLTFGSMCEDTLSCIETLRGEAPAGPLIVMGTRWGSLIAASAAARHTDASVVLWEPLLEASRFFKDAFRSRLVRELRRGVDRPATGKELGERLRAGEGVDVVAHRLEAGLYRSSIERSLEAELGTAPREMLVVQVGPTGSVRPDLARLVRRWRDHGLLVDAEGVRGDETWWLVDEVYVDETKLSLTDELIGVTTAWASAKAGSGEG